MLSLYILICNLNWCFPSLWWFLYQIHNFSNNLCDKEMFMSHLMWCANYIKNIFHDKNNITHFEREKKNRKALAKPVPCLGLLLQKRTEKYIWKLLDYRTHIFRLIISTHVYLFVGYLKNLSQYLFFSDLAFKKCIAIQGEIKQISWRMGKFPTRNSESVLSAFSGAPTPKPSWQAS